MGTTINNDASAQNKHGFRKPTQVDEGWRVEHPSAAQIPTQADTGWRNNQSSLKREATQVDEGWRAGVSAGRQATQVDEGWRLSQQRDVRKATLIDEGWRKAATDMLDPSNVMNRATANAFPNIDNFQEAVGNLPELTSSTGQKYPVKKTLSRSGGESAILMCADPNGRDVVAKVYYEPVNSAGSSISARTRVLEYMRSPDGQKYTLAVSEIGLVELGGSRYYFEIMPYCPDGDLSKEPAFSYEDILKLTKYLNEALHSMHSAGILHRDIKPDNLYRLNGRVVIGDFGVAKLTKAGVTRHTAGTDGYRAPESVLAVSAGESAFFFDEKCDYYSLGVTLGSLFEGHFVYEGMNAAMITAAVRNGRLPLSRIDPHREQLENLLCGLCKYDSRFRFGYEDVCKWLVDQNYTGGVVEDEWPKSFRMLNEEYRDEKSLFMGITKDAAHWNEGKDLLYSKYFENFFMSFRTDLARAAQIADESWRTDDRDKGLSVFLKSLYAPGPIVWKGYTFGSLRDLAEKMAVTKTPTAYGEILQKRCVSHWLTNTEGIKASPDTVLLVNQIEERASQEPELACYWFGNSFAKTRSITVCNRNASEIGGLIASMFNNPRDFYLTDGFTKLISRTSGADLYGFLYSLGYKEIIEKEWKHAQKCDVFNRVTVLMSMLDMIATRAGADTTVLRRFFKNYGPLGIATFTKALVERSSNQIYVPLDTEGKRVINQIKEFRAPATGSVGELFRAYAPLIESTQKLQEILIDNPFCISSGVYEKKGILCTNLIGCFSFQIFGKLAPLGFNSLVEAEKGGQTA